MGLIRVRDFAKECGCTPQNIYKHIRNYATELDGHVLDSARGKLLDEFACDFIREAMYPRELDTGSEVTKMAQELAELRAAFMKLGQEILRIASELLQTQGERDRALLDLQQHRKLLQAAEDAEEARQAELAKATRTPLTPRSRPRQQTPGQRSRPGEQTPQRPTTPL